VEISDEQRGTSGAVAAGAERHGGGEREDEQKRRPVPPDGAHFDESHGCLSVAG
jgi:hypothetical protein